MTESFRDKLRRGAPLLGTFLKTPSPILCEVLGRSALDLVCLDAEHAPFGRVEIDACVMALRAVGLPSIVRVPTFAPDHILAALDCGATGVLVPHITSADQARAVAQAAHYGRGGRGYAGSTRAAGYSAKTMPEHLRDSAATTTVIVQIEDVEAVEAVDEIAAVEGVDALFVGRMDLTVAMGCDRPDDPKVVDAVRRVCRAGRAAGRAVGMFVPDVAEAADWMKEGAGLFILGSEHSFMLAGAKTLAAGFATAKADAGL